MIVIDAPISAAMPQHPSANTGSVHDRGLHEWAVGRCAMCMVDWWALCMHGPLVQKYAIHA